MTKANAETPFTEPSLEALILKCEKDRYKLGYAAMRWAKEIKMKENLPESVSKLIPRALREILLGKISLKEIEKLPMIVKMSTPPPPMVQPTLSLNVVKDDGAEEKKDK